MELDNDTLISMRKELQKWRDKGPLHAIKIMDTLQKAQITKQQLAQTEISKTLSSLSKIESEQEQDKQVKEKAKNIIDKWKEMCNQQKEELKDGNKQMKKLSSQTSINSETEKKINSQTSLKQENKQQQKKEEEKISQKKTQQKTVNQQNSVKPANINSNNLEEEDPIVDENGLFSYKKSEIRNKMIQNFKKILMKELELLNEEIKVYGKEINQQFEEVDEKKVNEVAGNLEKAVFQKNKTKFLTNCHQMLDNYKNDIKIICQNLGNNQIGREIKQRVFLGETTIAEIASCKTEVFISKEEKQLQMQKALENYDASDPDFYKKLKQKAYRKKEGEICRFCKNKSAYLVQELQTRSADEPMTRFMSCHNCNKSWKD